MTDKSISQLTAGVAVSDTDLLPNVQVVGVGPVKTTAAQIKTYVNTNPVVTGVLAAPNGSAAAPSFTFDGDLNTGWFRPAADTIAGATAGSERIRLDSVGNLGLGVTPTASSNYTVLDIKGKAAGQSAIIRFYDGAGTQTGAIQSDTNYGFVAAASGSYPVTIFTNGNERMAINSAGNVGIGTSSPTQKLDVTGTIRIKNGTNGYLMGPTGEMLVGEDNTGVYVGGGFGINPAIPIAYGTIGTTLHRWLSGGDERMRLTSAGNLGIGTTVPTAIANASSISLNATASNTSGLVVYQTNGSQIARSGILSGYLVLQDLSSANGISIDVQTVKPIVFSTSATERMRIDASGNVGIGTSSPGTRLDVSGVARATTFSFSGTTAFSVATISSDANWGMYFRANTTPANAEYIWANGAGTERMRIDTSGNVGIGVASITAGYKLEVAGNVYASSGFISSKNSANQVYFGAGGQMNFGIGGSDLIIGTTAAPIRFGSVSTNAEWMRIDASGNVGIGAAPSNAFANIVSLQVKNTFISGRTNLSSWTQFGVNYYSDAAGTNKYLASDFASQYQQYLGVHTWSTAASGTAGNTATFTTNMTLDASGNLGLGVTPSAWQTSGNTRALEFSAGSVWSFSTTAYFMSQNSYIASGGVRTYKTTAAATEYSQTAGQHQWFTAASGTAGNAITFTQAMTLDASGNLGVGSTSPSSYSAKLAVAGNIGVLGATYINFWNSTNTTVQSIRNDNSKLVFLKNNGAVTLTIDDNSNVVVNTAAVATAATDGFLYVPGCAGIPTGTPTSYTGRVPIVVDTTNNKLYFYSGGAWRDAGP